MLGSSTGCVKPTNAYEASGSEALTAYEGADVFVVAETDWLHELSRGSEKQRTARARTRSYRVIIRAYELSFHKVKMNLQHEDILLQRQSLPVPTLTQLLLLASPASLLLSCLSVLPFCLASLSCFFVLLLCLASLSCFSVLLLCLLLRDTHREPLIKALLFFLPFRAQRGTCFCQDQQKSVDLIRTS